MLSSENKVPRVALLLATYNGENNVFEQLISIQNQINVLCDVYISDDGSSDSTLKIIDGFHSANFKVLPYIKSGGAGANFFRLLRDVNFDNYDYVAFSDQDDLWFSEKISNAVNYMLENNADGYSCNVTAFWSDGRKILIDKAQPQKKWDYFFEAAGPGCTYVIQANIANKLKDMLVNSKELVENIEMHDWFIYAWARHNDFRWFIDKKPSMYYRQHLTNVIGVNNGFVAAKSRFDKLCNGWYLKQIMLIAHTISALDQPPILWINNPSMANKCKLLVSVFHCRRRLRDQLAFIFFIFMLSNSKKK